MQHHQHNIYQVNGGGGGLSQTPQTFPHFLAPEKIHRRLEEMGGWYKQNNLSSHFIYYASASSLDKKEELKKTIFVKTTTTKPPIVWFPGINNQLAFLQ